MPAIAQTAQCQSGPLVTHADQWLFGAGIILHSARAEGRRVQAHLKVVVGLPDCSPEQFLATI